MSNLVLSEFNLPVEYIKIINDYPVLDKEEEFSIASRFYTNGNRTDAEKLVFSNFRGVLFVARQYNGYKLPFMDMVQEGIIGLMKAVKRFNPFKGVRLFTYAMPWIKAEIQKYISNNWKLVKITTSDSKRKLFFGLRKLKQSILPSEDNDLLKISSTLKIDVDELRQVESYMYSSDVHIDDIEHVDSIYALCDDNTPEQRLISYEHDYHVKEDVKYALQQLSEREHSIIERRYFKTPPDTLSAIAGDLDISIERVRQIEAKALASMQRDLSYFKS